MKLKKINKKGELGMNTSKMFVLGLLSLAILAMVVLVVLNSLTSSDVAFRNGGTTLSNSTLTSVTESGKSFFAFRVTSTSNVIVTNATGGEIINAGNYTVSGDRISFSAAQTRYNNTNWNVSLGLTFSDNRLIGNLTNNISTGVSQLFTNSTTWFSLLAIVIIILVISIIIVSVNQFGTSDGSSASEPTF